MITLYRYVKRKRAEKAQDQQGEPATTTPDGAQEVKAELQPKKKPVNWRWLFTLGASLALPVYLETLDYTVVATAQTHIASSFDRLDLQSWIGNAYLLTSTVFLPFFASIADIYGRHFGMQLALLFFILGSALSTGAQSMEMMIGGRAVAGIGGAGILGIGRAIMADSSSIDDNNWQTGMLFILYTLGYCTGPVIGGVLLTVSFRWIFAINLPTSALAMVLIFLLLRGKVKRGHPSERMPAELASSETYFSKLLRIDWIGTAFFVAAGILVLLALSIGSTEDWNKPIVISGFVVGGVLFIATLVWEYILERPPPSTTTSTPTTLSKWRWADPMLPLDTLTSYDVIAVQFGAFVSGMVMLVMFYFVAIYMIVVTGLKATEAGVQLIYFAPGMGGGTLISMQITRQTRQPKYAIIFGSLLIPIALGLISMAMNSNKQAQVNGFMVMAGIGCGLTISTLMIHARFSLPSKRAAVVAAMSLFFRSLGGTVGLAQCGAILNAKVRSFIIAAVESGALSAADASRSASLQGPNSVDAINQLSPEGQEVIREAFRQGSRWSFISLIPWAGLSFLLMLFLKNIKTTDQGVTALDDGPEKTERQRKGTSHSSSSPSPGDVEKTNQSKIEA